MSKAYICRFVLFLFLFNNSSSELFARNKDVLNGSEITDILSAVKRKSEQTPGKVYFIVNVNQPNSLKADAGEDVEILEGESSQIGGSPSAEFGYGNYTYQWSPEEFLDDPTSANPIANPNDPTTYTLVVTDEKNCTSEASVHVNVIHPEPVLEFAFNGQNLFSNQDIQICQNERVTLNLVSITEGRSPFEVTLAINGLPTIISGVDLENPQLYDYYPEVGQHTITITSIIDATGTSVASPELVYYATLFVNPLPEVSITASGDLELCEGETLVLTAPEAQSYLWSSEETSQSIVVDQQGQFQVTATNDKGCLNTSEMIEVLVYELPVTTLSAISGLCIDIAPFTLTGGLPLGGEYSGIGITDNIFDPVAAGPGDHLITYTYTDANGCTAIATTEISVVDVPNVTFAGIYDMCIDAGTFSLTGGLPAGGTYSGTGVTNGMFDPAVAGPGDHLITYFYYNATGCNASATGEIHVADKPNVTLDDLGSVCINTSPFILTAGLPVGGVYTGTGITDNIFNPAAAGSGEHMITYSYTNLDGCSDFVDATLTVNEMPEIKCIGDTTVMLTHLPFELTSALPAGGVYHGTGVQDGVFNAASAQTGDHVITYTFEDNNGCIADCQFVITVKLDTSTPEILIPFEVKIFPNPAQAILNIEANETIREVRMIDLLGQIMYDATINNMEHQIRITEYRNGIYFIQLLTSRGVTTHKVQINKSVY